MNLVGFIIRQDLKRFFLSAAGLTVSAFFLLLANYLFINFLANFNIALSRNAGNPLALAKINLNSWVVENFYLVLALLNIIVIPLFLTKYLTEDRQGNAWLLTLISPAKSTTLALAKSCSASVIILLLEATALTLPLLLLMIADPEALLILAGLAGSCLYIIAMTCFALALSYRFTNPLSVSFCAFVALALLASLQLIASLLPAEIGQVVNSFSPVIQLQKFSAGKPDLNALVYFISLILFSLTVLLAQIKRERHEI